MKEDTMNSGSREFDFNTMADMGRQMSENKKALDDVRSEFVGPVQEEDAPPEPTPVVLDGPATEDADNKVNLNELAYAAKRHLEEVGHPAADMLMTPANIKKLAEFENKRQRVERERLAYEEDPEGYDLNSANALDAYVKSWNLKHLSPEQLHPGPSTWKPGAADEATPPAGNAEVSRVAPDRGETVSVVRDGPSGGEASTPRRQSAGSSERPAPARSVPESKPTAATPTKGPSKTNNGITTGPTQMGSKMKAADGKTYEAIGAPPGTVKAYTPPANLQRGPSRGPSKVAQKNGPQADEPASNNAARAAMAEMIPDSIIPMALALGGLKGAKGMAEKVETKMVPTAQGMMRRAMGNRGAQAAAQEVNNNISKVSKPPGLAVRDMIAEQRASQAKSGYTAPGEKGYKPPTKTELDDVRYQNKVNVKAKKEVNPGLKSKASQKRAKKEGK